MKLKIEITMDNAAFGDDNGGEAGPEAARILRDLADNFSERDLAPGEIWNLHDANGNHVGQGRITR